MQKFLLIVFLACCGSEAQAETLIVSENNAASQIAQGFNLFRSVHGKEPQTWTDIESVFGRPLNEINKSILPTTRYAFLEKPLILSQSEDRIVILSRSAAHDEYKMRGFLGPILGSLPSSLKRYAIIVSPNGEAGRIAFSEIQIQKMFSEAGMRLPSPDPLGARPYEIANRFALGFWIAIMLASFLLMGYLAISQLFQKKDR